jgi:hypothetical protein
MINKWQHLEDGSFVICSQYLQFSIGNFSKDTYVVSAIEARLRF